MTVSRNPTAVVLSAPGTNRQHDAALALDLAGAQVRHVDVRDLDTQLSELKEAHIIVVAGGFSYADALGSARVFAMEMQQRAGDVLQQKADSGTAILGICNGFQMLVRAGVLPGAPFGTAALAHNERGTFECRWVNLSAVSSHCAWTAGLSNISCPVAHGEGRFTCDTTTYKALCDNDCIALRYVNVDGSSAGGAYPINPNGSIDDIAGVCNVKGNVLGMMPHPENHVLEQQGRSMTGSGGAYRGLALELFRNGVEYARHS
jgi:phosphoribosylformylglycinamidine synthase subunit PurQ / glutaminase